jgi:hypothetical protein
MALSCVTIAALVIPVLPGVAGAASSQSRFKDVLTYARGTPR